MNKQITLWTLQHVSVYEQLMKDGVYYKNDDEICIDDFYDAYRWMNEQMIARIGLPEFKDTKWPIWTWRYYYNASRAKPRRDYSLLGDYDNMVFMELKVSEERILESCFNLWHCVLNNWAISNDENENPRSTWDKIFDRSFTDEDWSNGEWEKRIIQACIWTLKREDVISASLLQKQEGRKALKVSKLL